MGSGMHQLETRKAEFRWTRWLFLRALAVIYCIAFLSLRVQIEGLVGRDGILPVEETLATVRERFPEDHVEVFPTLCWWSSSDGFLRTQCDLGIALAAMLLVDVAPVPCLVGTWVLYLSLTTAGSTFLSFQWDALLLETGMLAILFAPLKLRPGVRRGRAPSRFQLWCLRWLLFRLMFAAGAVKLASRDEVWWDLTALALHYETQPLPTAVGWYAHQLPMNAQRFCCGAMFFIELVVPFFIFLGRRMRAVAFAVFVFFQTLILLTGNYGFFNLLTLVLCIPLLDDAQWQRCLSVFRFRRRVIQEPRVLSEDEKVGVPPSGRGRERQPRVPGPAQAASSRNLNAGNVPVTSSSLTAMGVRLRTIPPLLVGVVLLLVSCIRFAVQVDSWREQPGLRIPLPALAERTLALVETARAVNTYGLFANMTETRPEIHVEGSEDGVTWKSYEFFYKPGYLSEPPCWVLPHMPRLDWQMWFAALSPRPPMWFRGFLHRLLQGSPPVLALLRHNPFPQHPPRVVRARVQDYRFSSLETRRQSGRWWTAGEERIYHPPVSLR